MILFNRICECLLSEQIESTLHFSIVLGKFLDKYESVYNNDIKR